MQQKWIAAGVMFSLSLIPLVGALPTYLPPGDTTCTPMAPVHSFGPFVGAYANSRTLATGDTGVSGMWPGPTGGDANLQDCPGTTVGTPGDYDGDTEFSFGGNLFPAGTYAGASACATGVTTDFDGTLGADVTHHPAGAGAQYWAYNTVETGADLAFTAGTDGPTLDDPTTGAAAPCQTNNIISDDPITDPWDCPGDVAARHAGGAAITGWPSVSTIGQGSHQYVNHAADGGVAGHNAFTGYVGETAEHATLHSGAALGIDQPSATCNGWDGYVLLFYVPGVFEDIDGSGTIFVSEPVAGDAGNL